MVRLTPADYRMQVVSPFERSVQGYQAGFGQMQQLNEVRRQRVADQQTAQMHQADLNLKTAQTAALEVEQRKLASEEAKALEFANIMTEIAEAEQKNAPRAVLKNLYQRAATLSGDEIFLTIAGNMDREERENLLQSSAQNYNFYKNGSPEVIRQRLLQDIDAAPDDQTKTGKEALLQMFDEAEQQEPGSGGTVIAQAVKMNAEIVAAVADIDSEKFFPDSGSEVDYFDATDLQVAIMAMTGYTSMEAYTNNATPAEREAVSNYVMQRQQSGGPSSTEAERYGLARAQVKFGAPTEENRAARAAYALDQQMAYHRAPSDAAAWMVRYGNGQFGTQDPNRLPTPVPSIGSGTGVTPGMGGQTTSAADTISSFDQQTPTTLEQPTVTPTSGEVPSFENEEFISGAELRQRNTNKDGVIIYDAEATQDGQKTFLTSEGLIADTVYNSDADRKFQSNVSYGLETLELLYELRDDPNLDRLYGSEGASGYTAVEGGNIVGRAIGSIEGMITAGDPEGINTSKAKLELIIARQFLEGFQYVKGAGPVTEREGLAAMAAMGSIINQAQSPEAARLAIDRAIGRIEKIVEANARAVSPRAYNELYGDTNIPQTRGALYETSPRRIPPEQAQPGSFTQPAELFQGADGQFYYKNGQLYTGGR
jgi:hypothetical protein